VAYKFRAILEMHALFKGTLANLIIAYHLCYSYVLRFEVSGHIET